MRGSEGGKAGHSAHAWLVAGPARKPEEGPEGVNDGVRDEVTSKDTTEKKQTIARKEIFIMHV